MCDLKTPYRLEPILLRSSASGKPHFWATCSSIQPSKPFSWKSSIPQVCITFKKIPNSLCDKIVSSGLSRFNVLQMTSTSLVKCLY